MNEKKWMRPRHRIICDIARVVLTPYTVWKYGLTAEPFREQGDRAYLILMNHQTPFDQFFVGLSFKGPIYYLASEDIFSNGWVSSLIRWLVAPIPIRKQTSDASAVMTCIRLARAGGTIALAPEGNRTYSGKTEHMNPAIAGMAKKMKLPIALFRIEGGYGVQPRWSDGTRKGKMRAYVSRVIEPEEYAPLSREELFAMIEEGLQVNEGTADGTFLSTKRAEYLERAVYVCPYCGLSEFESHGNTVSCKTCGRTITYGADKTLTGEGFDFPFRFMTQWYDYQCDFVRKLDLTQFTDAPAFLDRAKLSEVIVFRRKNRLRADTQVSLYGDRVVIDEGQDKELVLPFAEISAAAVLGRNKLNLYHGDKVYQFKGSKRFNALKYVNFYYHYKNTSRGDFHGDFLGL